MKTVSFLSGLIDKMYANIWFIILAVFLLVYSVEQYPSFQPEQKISISSTHLINYQNTRSHSPETLCAFNLISVFFVIYLTKKIFKIKHDPNLIFLGLIVGIPSNVHNAGILLFSAGLLFFIICVPFVLGWKDASITIGYATFFYLATLLFFSLSDYGLSISITFALAFGIIAYYVITKIMEFTLVFYNFIKSYINPIINRLSV